MVVISLTIAYLTYGTVNMQVIQPNEHTYTSDKLTHEYTFVFLSDLHYGSAQSEKTVDNALAKIAQLKLDFVLLGGDITDEKYYRGRDAEYIYFVWTEHRLRALSQSLQT